MREALQLMSELTHEDLDWLFLEGHERQVIANAQIIVEGQYPDALYFVLQGLLGIRSEALGNSTLTHLGPGEILGEMSLLEGKPASATVLALENSLLLVLPIDILRRKLDEDPYMATRFYHALGRIVSGRLRNSMGQLGQMLRDRGVVEELTSSQWDEISVYIEQFKALIQKADQAALKQEGQIPRQLVEEVQSGLLSFSELMNDTIGDDAPAHEAVKVDIGQRIKREMLPYLLLTRTAERAYAKPRGYAGDFATIDQIYRNEPVGRGRVGPLLDQAFLNLPACEAVRNRRHLLAEWIRLAIAEKADQSPARITSLACGPAAEVFDVYGQLPDPSMLATTLVDIDFQALAYLDDQISAIGLRRQMHPVNGNLVYLATGRSTLDLQPQDLIYSIGLIDYFNDKFVVTLLNFIHSLLRPGGKVVLGNFHPRNSTKALMDHVLDWRLIHRTEDDMNRLFKASVFRSTCSNVRFEEQGINLFAECIRGAE
jgi:extracellular factor (EF) 3-hydroxypalmitic acid methyl ester biosynthesis protein